jgi:ADP-ribosylglycohydrolase
MTPSRYRGCLLGLAAGDALGTTLEFTPPWNVRPLTDLVGGGPFGLKPGQWTDDTSMALCLAESVAERGFDPAHQLDTYVRWYRRGHLSSTGGCFDIGNTTRLALHRFEREPQPFPGPTDDNSAGNGSLMRLAPVPLRWAFDPPRAVHLAGESSRTTHGAVACVDACRYFAALIVGALHGRPKAELLAADFFREPLCPAVAEVAAGSFRAKQPPDIRGTGFVVKSLEAALWAFHATDSFESGALAAVNLGDDADTTGAVFGQLGGAFYDEAAIPEGWRAKLAMRELIERRADELLALALAGTP